MEDAVENVRTIDSWQGREKEFMIFSSVRCNIRREIGFLQNYRRTNVALTRAKHGLIIFGNANTLSSDDKWDALISFFKSNGSYTDGIVDATNKVEKLMKEFMNPQIVQSNLEEDFI